MRRLVTLGAALACGLAAGSAWAEVGPDAGAGKTPREGAGFLADARVGGLVPFGGMSPNFLVGIGIGAVLPWMHRSFAVALDLDYTQPEAGATQSDPRVTGGTYGWHLTQQELALMPVVMYRMTTLGKITPYVGIGPRIYFLQSTVGSSGSPKFQSTTETGSSGGVGIPLGVEYQLGPGGLLAELLFQYGGLSAAATGSSSTGALSLGVGYRFLP